jgi:hypothetical protein
MGPGGRIAFHDLGWTDVRLAVDSFPWASRVEHDTIGKLTVCEIPV